MFFYGKVKNIQ